MRLAPEATIVTSLRRHDREFENANAQRTYGFLKTPNFSKKSLPKTKERKTPKIYHNCFGMDASFTRNNKGFIDWWLNVRAIPGPVLPIFQKSCYSYRSPSNQCIAFLQTKPQKGTMILPIVPFPNANTVKIMIIIETPAVISTTISALLNSRSFFDLGQSALHTMKSDSIKVLRLRNWFWPGKWPKTAELNSAKLKLVKTGKKLSQMSYKVVDGKFILVSWT